MTSPAREVWTFIVSSLRQRLAESGIDPQSVSDDFDLRAHGVIDSLGFIRLLGALENRFGPLDLADVAPEELTRIGALARHVAAQLAIRPSNVE